MLLLPLLFSCIGFCLGEASAPYTSCPGGYKNGEKIREGNFVKQCTVSANSYSIDVIGCLTKKGTEILIGSQQEENNMVFKCIATDDGGAKVEMLPAGSNEPSGPKENLKCKDKYANGEKFNEGSFVKQCKSTPTSWSVAIAACLTPSGKEIAIGAKAEEDKLIYSCVQTEKGAAIETDLAVKGCEDGKYQQGQTYLSSNKKFLFKCVDDYGSNDIVACITDNGKEVKAGAELVEGVFKYKCVKESNGSVRYQKEPVGGMKHVENGCGQYKIGQHILSTSGKFKFTCVSAGKIDFTACIVDGGEVKADTIKTIGNYEYDCKSSPNGGASVARKMVA